MHHKARTKHKTSTHNGNNSKQLTNNNISSTQDNAFVYSNIKEPLVSHKIVKYRGGGKSMQQTFVCAIRNISAHCRYVQQIC